MIKIVGIKVLVFIAVFGSFICLEHSRAKISAFNSVDEDLRILYTGNMGVLIESSNQTVLIDGFHKEYKPAYAHPSQEMVDSLIHGQYPGFAEIELNLVTHKHKDHFNAELTLQFLKKNRGSLTIGPLQVKEELEEAEDGANRFLERIKTLGAGHAIDSMEHHGISVKAIEIGHTYQVKHRDIQNMAYLIDINGYKVFHIGDSDWAVSKSGFDKLNLVESNIDVAILPFWMLIEKASKTMVNDLIKPKIIVASHIDPNFADQQFKRVRDNFPDAIGLVEIGGILKI